MPDTGVARSKSDPQRNSSAGAPPAGAPRFPRRPSANPSAGRSHASHNGASPNPTSGSNPDSPTTSSPRAAHPNPAAGGANPSPDGAAGRADPAPGTLSGGGGASSSAAEERGNPSPFSGAFGRTTPPASSDTSASRRSHPSLPGTGNALSHARADAGDESSRRHPGGGAAAHSNAPMLIFRISVALSFFIFSVVVIIGLAGGGTFRATVLRGMAAAFFGFLAGIVSLGTGWSFLAGLSERDETRSGQDTEGATT